MKKIIIFGIVFLCLISFVNASICGYTNSTSAGVGIADRFQRPNSASMGSTETGQAWIDGSADSISSNTWQMDLSAEGSYVNSEIFDNNSIYGIVFQLNVSLNSAGGGMNWGIPETTGGGELLDYDNRVSDKIKICNSVTGSASYNGNYVWKIKWGLGYVNFTSYYPNGTLIENVLSTSSSCYHLARIPRMYVYSSGNNIKQIMLWNSSLGECPSISYSQSSVYVLNKSLNFTSGGGQICGFNGSSYSLCGPTEEETPSFRFQTSGNADCKLWNQSQNYSTIGDKMNCSTTGTTIHFCTFPDSLPDKTHTLYLSCKSGNYEMNSFVNANVFNISIYKSSANQNSAIQQGIDSSVIAASATTYTGKKVYLRTLSNQQIYGTVDTLAINSNQRWLFNYFSAGESAIGLFNLTSAIYSLEMSGMTNTTIKNTVSKFINDTRVG